MGLSCAFSSPLPAQSTPSTPKKLPVFGAFSVGYGNTFLRGALGDKETTNDGRGFGRNDGFSFSTFYYWSPDRLRGLGIGTGIKGFIARPNEGGDNETYTYNYYHVGLGIKSYLFTNTFNRGFALKANLGYGPATERMEFANTNTYDYQNANGLVYLAGLTYSLPLGESRTAFTVDFDYEYSSRRANITGSSESVNFINSHVSLNFGLTF